MAEEVEDKRRSPIAMIRSDEAMFETFHTDGGGVMLVMRPHGVEKGDDKEVGWSLTWAEVEGFADVAGRDDARTGRVRVRGR